MRVRQLKFWLVLLNLMTFNAYALATSIAPQMADRSQVQSGCSHMTSTSVRLSTGAIHVKVSQARVQDMPCCKYLHDDLMGHDASCGCKTGTCSAVQLAAVANSFAYSTACSSSKVDAISTIAPVTQRGQRLLRPPIR